MNIDLSNPLVLMGVSAVPVVMFAFGIAAGATTSSDTNWSFLIGAAALLYASVSWITAFCQMAQPYLP